MTFATLEGKLVQSGGMVVKNVAGLDMAKLMIGSFGTLGAIAVVNLKVVPQPAYSLSFVLSFASAEELFTARCAVRGVLQPAAVDVLNPAGAARLGRQGYCCWSRRARRCSRPVCEGTHG
jgi:glycolate oxidase FAD binding subunit